MLKIALNELGGNQWTGGITYRTNLLKAMEIAYPELKLYFISISQEPNKDIQNLVLVKLEKGNKLERFIDRFIKKYLNYDYLLTKSISQLNIDIVFPHSLKTGNKIKTIYWIPDFQFMHLPHLYSSKQIAGFTTKLKRYFRNADLIIVSSKDAETDFKSFAPEFIAKVRVMEFVAHIPNNLYDINPEDIGKIYNLPIDFLYVPNQFWAHKNHTLILQALKILKERKIEPVIVCSGNPIDTRNPGYFAEFLKLIAEFGLHNQIIILGLLPHNHVYCLMRQSKCVLNPSLFEGWSTSVEEAKSIGKRMILSDLSVHVEQNPKNSLFFLRNDPNDLANAIEKFWNEVPGGPDLKMEQEAIAAQPKRMKEFANKFIDICKEAHEK